MEPIVLKALEAAMLLGMSVSELYRQTAPHGPIPYIKHGKRGKRYLVKDLKTYLDSRRVERAS